MGIRGVIKMGMTDSVAEYILRLLSEENGIAEIQRNELASSMGCVPSQINYVITSRFTPEHGYIVESRRGGGGYIRITRRQLSKTDKVMHIINCIGDKLDIGTSRAMIENILQSEIINLSEAKLISAALSSQALSSAPREIRDDLRASIFKTMLLVTKV